MNDFLKTVDRERLLAELIAGRFPDERGRYGPFGGRYVPETLVPAHERLEAGVRRWLRDPAFQAELNAELANWVGRPTALSHAPHLSRSWGAEVWLKREDLAHTGAQINNALDRAGGQRLGEAHRCRDRRGQHGVASAAACARRTAMHGVHGAVVNAAPIGRMTAGRDRGQCHERRSHCAPPSMKPCATGSAIRTARSTSWVPAVGAHPYPVREFGTIIGREHAPSCSNARQTTRCGHCLRRWRVQRLGLFHAFIADRAVEILASRRAALVRTGELRDAVR
jgi:tryptophan synthase beta chain